jgi:hypothetical protein
MNGPTVTEEFLNERGVQLVSKRESL